MMRAVIKSHNGKNLLQNFWTYFLPAAIPAFTTIFAYIREIEIPTLFLWLSIIVAIILLIHIVIDHIKGEKSIKQGLKDSRTCLILLGMIIVCYSISSFFQQQERLHLQKEVAANILKEQEYIYNNTHGLQQYYSHDYTQAIDSLRIYKNDPVSLYYYGTMLYYGLGTEYNTEKGIKYIEESASNYFFRANFFLFDYYMGLDNKEKAVYYAKQIIVQMPDSFPCSAPNTFYTEKYRKFIENQCLEALSTQPVYNYIYYYYTSIHPNFFLLSKMIELHYESCAMKYLKFDDTGEYVKDVCRPIDKAWAMWSIESKLLGRIWMWWNANISLRNSRGWIHMDYAHMLLDVPKNYTDYQSISLENISLSRIKKAERHAIKALQLSSTNIDNVSGQSSPLLLLYTLQEKLGYKEEAYDAFLLSTDLKIKRYYESLVH